MKTTHKFLLSATAALTMIAPCDAMLRTVARGISTGLTTAAASPRPFWGTGNGWYANTRASGAYDACRYLRSIR